MSKVRFELFFRILVFENSPDTLLEGDTDQGLVVLAVVEPVLGGVAGVHDRGAEVAADVATLLQVVASALGQGHVFLGTLIWVLPLKKSFQGVEKFRKNIWEILFRFLVTPICFAIQNFMLTVLGIVVLDS